MDNMMDNHERRKYLLIINGTSHVLKTLLSEINPEKIVTISIDGCTDATLSDKNLQETLDNPTLDTEEKKQAAKTKWLRQVFNRAVAGLKSNLKEIVVVDNTGGIAVDQEHCISQARTFGYEIETVTSTSINQNGEKKKKSFF